MLLSSFDSTSLFIASVHLIIVVLAVFSLLTTVCLLESHTVLVLILAKLSFLIHSSFRPPVFTYRFDDYPIAPSTILLISRYGLFKSESDEISAKYVYLKFSSRLFVTLLATPSSPLRASVPFVKGL